MASEQDLQTTLDTIKADVAAVGARLQTQADQIQALRDQLAAGTPVTQDQLDALASEATEIATSLGALLPTEPPAPAAAG